MSALCSTNRHAPPHSTACSTSSWQALGDEDEGVASRAEDFLLWFGPDAAPAVADVVRLGSAPHRSVWILGQIGGAEALEPLIEALERYDARGRAEACVALGELRDPIAVNALLYATHDSDHVVRVKAAAALDRIGTAALLIGLSTLSGKHAPPKRRPMPRRTGTGRLASREPLPPHARAPDACCRQRAAAGRNRSFPCGSNCGR